MHKLFAVLLGLSLAGSAWAGCDTPYFPVKEGWTWTYKNSLEGKTSTNHITNISASGFDMTPQADAGSSAIHFRCEAGGLSSPDFGSSNFGHKLEFKTLGAQGVIIPNNLGPGLSWSYSFTLESGKSHSTIKNETSNKAVGEESITVPAGTFKALKVESIVTTTISLNMGGKTKTMPAKTSKSTSWYVRGVGLVKTIVLDDLTTELVSLKK